MKKPGADLFRARAVANSLIQEYKIEKAPTPIIDIAHKEGLETSSAEFEEGLIVSGLLDFENLQESDNYAFGGSFEEAIKSYGELMITQEP